jgi:gentisate 1,2-dioxygenase
MSVEDYKKAGKYEALMMIALKCPRNSRNGAHLYYMQNAIVSERNIRTLKDLNSFYKQLDKVKNYLSKALIQLSSRKPFSKSSKLFITFEEMLPLIDNTSDLLIIIENALDISIMLRDYTTE